jgi:Zn-dependent protease with chaperone function
MRIAVYLPMLASALFGLIGPYLASRMRPAAGVWALSVGSVVAAAGSTWSLLLLSATLIDDNLSANPRVHAPVSDLIALAAAAALGVVLVRLEGSARGRWRMRRQLREACSVYPQTDLIVLDDPTPRAFSLPGRPPHIVVSRGMLRALSPAERRVMIAHERAHLSARHHRHIELAAAAATLNPLLGPAQRSLSYLCERWADERAADSVGDRTVIATALARAALATVQPPAATLAFHELGVAQRVTALRTAPPRRWAGLTLGVLLLATMVIAAEVEATTDFLTLTGAVFGF